MAKESCNKEFCLFIQDSFAPLVSHRCVGRLLEDDGLECADNEIGNDGRSPEGKGNNSSVSHLNSRYPEFFFFFFFYVLTADPHSATLPIVCRFSCLHTAALDGAGAPLPVPVDISPAGTHNRATF